MELALAEYGMAIVCVLTVLMLLHDFITTFMDWHVDETDPAEDEHDSL